MRDTIKIFKALSDENRLRLLFALRQGELCVCQLIELMGLAPSTTSKHLSLLRDAGLLDARKQGRWVYYRLADKPRFPIVGKGASACFQSLEKSPAIRRDNARLRHIRAMDLEVLCGKMRKR